MDTIQYLMTVMALVLSNEIFSDRALLDFISLEADFGGFAIHA